MEVGLKGSRLQPNWLEDGVQGYLSTHALRKPSPQALGALMCGGLRAILFVSLLPHPISFARVGILVPVFCSCSSGKFSPSVSGILPIEIERILCLCSSPMEMMQAGFGLQAWHSIHINLFLPHDNGFLREMGWVQWWEPQINSTVALLWHFIGNVVSHRELQKKFFFDI